MKFPAIPDRSIRLKRESRTTPQGCHVLTSWYTSMRGEVTQDIVLECPRPILPAPRSKQ